MAPVLTKSCSLIPPTGTLTIVKLQETQQMGHGTMHQFVTQN